MSLFRTKNKKITVSDQRVTLDASHNEMLRYFQELQNSLPEKYEMLEEFKREYNQIKNNVGDYQQKYNLELRMSELDNEIKKIENREEEREYFLNTSHILYRYYENQKNVLNNTITNNDENAENHINNQCNQNNSNDERREANNHKKRKNEIKKNINNKNSILHFFFKEQEQLENSSSPSVSIDSSIHQNENDVPMSIENIQINPNVSAVVISNDNISDSITSSPSPSINSNEISQISNYFNLECEIRKEDLIKDYMRIIDPNNQNLNIYDRNYFICQTCNIEKNIISSEGIIVCSQCGSVEQIIIDSEKPSYKDPPHEVSYFAYKRINHFSEWLSQFQAKESTDIPQEVYDKILLEMKKERIQNTESLTHHKIREYLKKLKLNKYYEHVPHILNKLNGISPPTISREIEERLRIMFKEIQAPFMEVCPKNRKNFLSYSYVLHKFVELLGLNEYKKCFPLLKSREKLHQQDMIWKEICNRLNWPFFKSI